jgi:hypothetical protein
VRSIEKASSLRLTRMCVGSPLGGRSIVDTFNQYYYV